MTRRSKKPSAKIPKITSGFAILDVKSGRKWLEKYYREQRPATPKEGIGSRPVNPPLKVTIEGYIADVWGNDDGVSREFEIDVRKVKIAEIKRKKP